MLFGIIATHWAPRARGSLSNLGEEEGEQEEEEEGEQETEAPAPATPSPEPVKDDEYLAWTLGGSLAPTQELAWDSPSPAMPQASQRANASTDDDLDLQLQQVEQLAHKS